MQGKIKKMRDKIMQKRDVVPEEEKKDPSMDTVNIIISNLDNYQYKVEYLKDLQKKTHSLVLKMQK